MPIATVKNYCLRDEEIEACKQDSSKGNADASFRLYQHYRFVRLDENEAMKWLFCAAKNGHAVAQYNLALNYETQGKPEDAVKWATLALNNGVARAREIIEKK